MFVSDFSLKEWLNIFDESVSISPLPNPVSSILMSQLGITEYLDSNSCEFGSQPFHQSGWNLSKCLFRRTCIKSDFEPFYK